jgi:hypothetical protein
MTHPTSLEAFADCEEHFNRALAAERGIVIECASEGQANRLRQRLNTYRVRIRTLNSKIYPEGDPMNGKSQWDHLICRIPKENPNEVVIDKQALVATVKVREL